VSEAPFGGAAGMGDDDSTAVPRSRGRSRLEARRGASTSAACASTGLSDDEMLRSAGAVGSPACGFAASSWRPSCDSVRLWRGTVCSICSRCTGGGSNFGSGVTLAS
jgi:hypothetical protein